jgi:hypothetical protein
MKTIKQKLSFFTIMYIFASNGPEKWIKPLSYPSHPTPFPFVLCRFVPYRIIPCRFVPCRLAPFRFVPCPFSSYAVRPIPLFPAVSSSATPSKLTNSSCLISFHTSSTFHQPSPPFIYLYPALIRH